MNDSDVHQMSTKMFSSPGIWSNNILHGRLDHPMHKHGNCYRQQKYGVLTLPAMETGQNTSIFGSCGDADMLLWMRSVALDPTLHSLSENDQEMHKQALSIRKCMDLSGKTAPRRKRKLEHFLKARSTLHSQRRISKAKVNNHLPSLPSPISAGLINSVNSSKSSHNSASSLTCEDNNDVNKKNPSLPNTNNTDTPNDDITLIIIDSDASVHGSSSSNTKEDRMNHYLKKPRRSTRLQNFVGDHNPTMVVPIGSCFQANIPEWTDPSAKRVTPHDGIESLKWLGIKIWPIKTRNSENRIQQHVGKGRSDSCTCKFPGSRDCVKRHVREQRRALKATLGPGFRGWKFDEMGEDAAKSWSSDDQEKFRNFMKSSTSNGIGFWKNIFRFLPSKRCENIVSYYFNVYIRRRIMHEEANR